MARHIEPLLRKVVLDEAQDQAANLQRALTSSRLMVSSDLRVGYQQLSKASAIDRRHRPSDNADRLAPTETQAKEDTMDEKEMMERLHAVEVAQATGVAALARSMATMVAGGIALIAGVFIGLNVRTAR